MKKMYNISNATDIERVILKVILENQKGRKSKYALNTDTVIIGTALGLFKDKSNRENVDLLEYFECMEKDISVTKTVLYNSILDTMITMIGYGWIEEIDYMFPSDGERIGWRISYHYTVDVNEMLGLDIYN